MPMACRGHGYGANLGRCVKTQSDVNWGTVARGAVRAAAMHACTARLFWCWHVFSAPTSGTPYGTLGLPADAGSQPRWDQEAPSARIQTAAQHGGLQQKPVFLQCEHS